ncbi:collagen alpha-1(XII) chain-like [Narcine bancroftii]|uniref:collagen alpha-1(XII) chain-like n=1 Tax=Narcine bancroftii TaxID=1343680 RepID=UPI003831CCD2
MKMYPSITLLATYSLALSLFVTDSLQQATKRDIVFLVDGSQGMGRSFYIVRKFISRIIYNLNIGPDKDQVAVVQYSMNPRLEFGLKVYSTRNELFNALKQLRYKTVSPLNTGAALNFVTRNVFTPAAGSRKDAGAAQILVLITAGKSRDDVGPAAAALRQAGIVPIAIGAKSADKSELQQITSDSDSTFMLNKFQEFPSIQQQLTSKIQAVAVIEEPVPPAEVTTPAEIQRDIVFLLDESDYIGNSNLPAVRDFISTIIERLDIGSDRVQVGLVLYSNTAETEFYLSTYSRKDELLSLLRPLRLKGGKTLNTGKALDFVLRYHFIRSAGSRREEGVPQFLVLITGGRSGDDIKRAAHDLKQNGIITLTVGSGTADPAQLKEIAFEPNLSFNVRNFYSLPGIQEQVITSLQRLRVQTVPIEEATVPTEVSLVTTTKARKRDIVFLIDGTSGMGRSLFHVREFLMKIIPELNIGPDEDHLALVQYSFDSSVAFYLNSFSTKAEVMNAIKKMRLKMGRFLKTGAALDFVTRNVFTPAAGSRRDAGAAQILVLITAGKSRDDVGSAAEALRQAGIVSIAIGAKNADMTELQQITSDPDTAFKLNEFQDLPSIQQQLLSKAQPVVVIKEPIVYTKVIAKEMSKRDVVFLIDGSDNIGNDNLPYVRDFITRVIQHLAIGRDKVQVGLAQYSDDTEAEFYLNTYWSEAELLNHVKSLSLRGGKTANTGSALDFVMKYYFTSYSGSRIEENVPQFLLLITGGRSSDNVEEAADMLKRAGVMTFTIGVNSADPAQLEEMAIDPSLVFKVKKIRSLPDVLNQLIIPLTSLSVPTIIIEEPTAKPEEEEPVITTEVPRKQKISKKRDIAFLIDGSPGMGRSFQYVREFLKKIVQEFDLGPDEDQVAVVQYSIDPRLEFGFNIYSTKNELLHAIKKLSFKTGKPLNTGAALDFVTRNVFTPAAGSRRDAGAAQILILITAGKSKDDVGPAAEALRQAGIMPIAIGAKSADNSELQQITSDPDAAFMLNIFQDLPLIQQQLLSKAQPVAVIEEPIPPTEVIPVISSEMSERDVVFLIDGSDNIGNNNLPYVRDFITRVIQHLDIGRDKVRVGLAQYSDDTEAEFYLNTYWSEAELLNHVRSLSLRGGMTANTGSALDFAIKYFFTSSAGSRIKENVPQFLLLITGGRSGDDVEEAADMLKRAAVMTFAIGVSSADAAQLEEMAIDPSLVFRVEEIRSLPSVLNQLIMPLTMLSVPTVIIEEPTAKPEEEKPVITTEGRKKDIVFLIDGSPGMGRSFQYVRGLLFKVIQELDIGPDTDQVAVVQYSSNPKLEFGLNVHPTKEKILRIVGKLKLKTGRPLNTGVALDFVLRNVFTPAAGSRRDVGAAQILVLITAGKSKDDVGPAAEALRQAGIVPIAIGAKSADASELQQITSNPDSIMILRDIRELLTVQPQLLSKVGAVFEIEETIPPTQATPQEVDRRDIVFLIDGSATIGNVNFMRIREFVTKLVDTLDIGRDRVQVGVAQYSDNVRTEWFLNSYSTKAELLNHLKGLKVKGGRMVQTGAALDYVLGNHFTKAAGSRREEGVPQILVLITGARSTDDIRLSAAALKRAAVRAFAVGAKYADLTELKEIASDPSLVFKVNEFHLLPKVQSLVLTPLSTIVMKPSATMITPTVAITEAAPQEVNRRDIVFLIDGSATIGNVNFVHIREFVTKLVNMLDIGRDRVQVGVAQYSDNVRTEWFLNSYSTKAELLNHLKGLKVKGGRVVQTGAALDYVLGNHFTKAVGSRREEGVPQILVLITGTKATDDIRLPAAALKRAAVRTFAVGAKKADPVQLRVIASDPSLVFWVKEFPLLPRIQTKALMPLSTLPPLQLPTEQPIIHIKQVLPKVLGKKDIVFLIDASDYVSNIDFLRLRDFLTRIIGNLDIGSDGVQMGLVQYSNYAETEFYLNTYSTEDEIMSHMEGLRQRGGLPLNTGAALEYVRTNHFTRSSGSRKDKGVPQVLVLVLAGRSRDYVKQSVDALKRAGITVFAVGTRNTDPAQVKEIASEPALGLSVDEFRSLPDIEEQMMVSLSTLPSTREPAPQPTVSIRPAERIIKKDIVFLIDASDYVRNTDFAFVHEFLTRIIGNLDIGSDGVQMGLVQYSNYAETEFYLNTYSTEDEIMSHMEGLRQRGGLPLNTGAALDYVRTNHFTRSSGSRKDKGVPQVLVLVLAGRSRDYVKQSADALKRAGITVFAVGTRNTDPAQVKEIASEPALSLSVDEFRSLPDIQEQMMVSLSMLPSTREPAPQPTVPIRPALLDGASKRDIVFLIDGSDNVGNTNAPFVRDFLTSVIENLDIGSDQVQIGLVQYSNYAETEFYLNTYSSEDEIMSHIEGLRLRGGAALNTGGALQYVLRNHFTRSSGSRKDDGVPQFLVLIMAGRSRDDVRPFADALKQAAVTIFSIGTESADLTQLKEIAFDPSLVFRVREFHSLPQVQEEMMTPLTTLTISQVPPESPTVPSKQVFPEENKRDIVFLIDGSNNMGTANFHLVREFLTNIIENLNIGRERIQIGLVQYGTYAETEFYLNTYLSKAEILSHIRGLRPMGGTRLNTGAALDYVYRYNFISAAGSRKQRGIPQFLVLLTAGRASDNVKPPSDTMKRAAIMNFAIGVKNADLVQLKDIAIDPNLVFHLNTLDSLSSIEDEVTALMMTLPAPRAAPEEPTAPTKQVVPDVIKRDIVFLIDGSNNVGTTNVQYVRNFLTSIIENLNIGRNRVQVGLVQYSNYPETEFYLNTYSSNNELLSHVKGLRLRGGTSLNTGVALDSVLRYHFSQPAGSRRGEGVPQLLVLITGGRSGDDVSQWADPLKRAAVMMFVIAVKNADPLQIQEMSVDPGLIFKVQEFHSLPDVQEQLMMSVSTLAAPTVIHKKPTVIPEGPTETTTTVPSTMDIKKDIVFLVDESDYIGNSNLPLVRNFISTMIESLDIGSDRVRVGLVLYSNTAETEFYLNTYLRKDEVLNVLRTLRFKGGTTLNTGKALEFVLRYHFIRSAGSRREEGVPQFLVLITGGRSRDDIKRAAHDLKQNGIITLTVGSGTADPAQLKEIAFEPNLSFNVRDFNSLPGIQEQMKISLQRPDAPEIITEEVTVHVGEPVVNSEKVSIARKRDIVFLIDGTPGMGRSFSHVLNFLKKIIQEFDVGPDKDQVAIVQYSFDPRLEFAFNAYSTKVELLQAIKRLQLKKGKPLNTGTALDFVTRNVFTPAAGSRRDAGAAQILVLITAGKSRDDVGSAAEAMRQAGIMPIAVGTKNADTSELRQITSDPDAALNLNDLPLIQQQLLSKGQPVEEPIIITEVIPSEMSERDVVFLIDGSDNIGNDNLPYVRDFITRVIQHLAIGRDKVRVGLAQYSDDTEAEFYLNTYWSEAELLNHVRSLSLRGGMTANTGSALDFAIKYFFTSSAGSRIKENVPQFLLLITGGRSSDDVEEAADMLKRAAVMTFAIGVSSADAAQLEKMAIDPSLVFRVEEIRSLPSVLNQLIMPLTMLSVPTVIEETTIVEEKMVTTAEAQKRDIAFLIDGTPGMGKAFQHVRRFLKKVIQEFDIGPDKDQVAVVQYSSTPRLEFGFNVHPTKDEILDVVEKLKLKRGRPLNTGAALEFVTRNVFTPAAGSRRDVGAAQILVLITAGKSRDNVELAVEAVRQAGIVTIAIGTKFANTSELQHIVQEPSLVLKLSDFQELPTIEKELITKVKTIVIIEDATTVNTEVLPEEVNKRDIVFLVDGSENIGNSNVHLMHNFISNIIENLDIGSDRVRVGLAQFSHDTKTEFYLDSYSTKAEILSHVKGLKLKGGTTLHTGSALDFVFRNLFTEQAGSRKEHGVSQFLVVFTGGKSVDAIKPYADTLKRAAIATFAVGVQNADLEQLKEIATDSNLVFSVKEFRNLPSVHERVITPLSTLTAPTMTIRESTVIGAETPVPGTTAVVSAAAMRHDIAFLIDGTLGMGKAFPLIRKFLIKIILELDIGPEKDQVAVVQYSSDAKTEFALNTYASKDEVLAATKQIRRKTGRHLNTGAALEYVSRNIFIPSAGSRQDAGAKQILVLITSGKSKDDVGSIVEKVKQAHIVPIAVGAKNIDPSELQQIAYSSDFLIILKTFHTLPSFHHQLISMLKSVSV